MQNKPTYDELVAKIRDLESKNDKPSENSIPQLLQANLYRNIIQNMLHEVHIWELIKNQDGTIKTWKLVDANPKALNAWKKDLKDIVGKTADQVFPGANATEMFMPIVQKIMSEKKSYVWEDFFPGTGQMLYMVSIPFGEYFISTGIDITEIKKTQCELEETYLRLTEVIQASNTGLWDWDLKTDKVLFSKEWKKQLGYSEEEIANEYTEWESRVHPEDKDITLKTVKNCIDNKEDSYNSEFRMMHKDGTYRWIMTHGSVVHDEKHEPIRLLGSHIDITQRKKMENNLNEARKLAENASKAKTQLLANISHEMRTPLNAIIGFSDIMMDEAEGANLSEDFKEYIKYINVSGHNLNVTFENLLSLAKVDTKVIDINSDNINVFDLIQKIDNIIKFQIDQKDINLIYEIDPSLPKNIISDEVKLTQIIINLLTNAIKFTPKGKNVYLKVLNKSNELNIIVKDQGIGICDEIKEKIFISFEQGDSSITRKYGGSGLGLSIVKDFTELLGGKIEFKSKINEGSEFTIYLPLAINRQAQRNEGSLKSTYNFSNNNIILVIEDNNINQVTVKAILKKYGITAYYADDGELGIKKAIELEQQGKCPDLILMDLHMPVMSGTDATIKLRTYSQFQNTKIVALTADKDEEIQNKCLSIGMDDYLHKPIDQHKFKSMLERYLKKEDKS